MSIWGSIFLERGAELFYLYDDDDSNLEVKRGGGVVIILSLINVLHGPSLILRSKGDIPFPKKSEACLHLEVKS